MKNLLIKPLLVEDSDALSVMLMQNSEEYQKYFHPFAFEKTAIAAMLQQAKLDKYWGIWMETELIAFFMLRGFDVGYQVPSYGVCVAELHRGKGLLKLSLQFVDTWCKLFSVTQVMLKVHPNNLSAKKTYEEFGFVQTGRDPKNDNIIYHYTF